MATPTSGGVPGARSELRTRTALVLESIALRHQIAVLERSRTRRPCFSRFDRLFWILLSRWWPQWRDSLMIVQAETVLGWRRNGWSAIWRYRSHGRWRGGRPRVSCEVRHLITQMARENFLWGAPRIHGELLMLGFTVSQATVSRYMPVPSRRSTQSWRTFLRNQAIAFGHQQYPEEHSGPAEYLSRRFCSYWGSLMRLVAQIARLSAGLCRWHAHQKPTPSARRIALRSDRRARRAMHRAQRLDTMPGSPWKAGGNRLRTPVPMRSPPHDARASPRVRATQDVTFRVDQVLRRHNHPNGSALQQILSQLRDRSGSPYYNGLIDGNPFDLTRQAKEQFAIEHDLPPSIAFTDPRFLAAVSNAAANAGIQCSP